MTTTPQPRLTLPSADSVPRVQTGGDARQGPLAAGVRAPAFALRCGQYRAAMLDDYRGRPLVLAFYVADWHPVCTGQLERYRDLAPELDQLGAVLVAISPDSVWSQAAFARPHLLPFPLLADDRPRVAVARAYGVYDPLTESARRALFVADAGGIIAWSEEFPEALDPGVDGILTALEGLEGGRPLPPRRASAAAPPNSPPPSAPA